MYWFYWLQALKVDMEDVHDIPGKSVELEKTNPADMRYVIDNVTSKILKEKL